MSCWLPSHEVLPQRPIDHLAVAAPTPPLGPAPISLPSYGLDFFSLRVPHVCPHTVPVMVSPLTVRVKFTRFTGAFQTSSRFP
jgi:hypothetical protein